MVASKFLSDPGFQGIKPFESKVWLSPPTMHNDEQRWTDEAITTNRVSTVGGSISEVESAAATKVGCGYVVALSTDTAVLHLAVRLYAERIYGQLKVGKGSLEGHKVFCSDVTFGAMVNPVAYKGGKAVFIDTEYDAQNMDPVALKRAFEIYPDVKLVVTAHLYGAPGKVGEIKAICERHRAPTAEDTAESFGATYRDVQTGIFDTGSIISYNGNKIVIGNSEGVSLTDSLEDVNKARKWSTQSREGAAWYQHKELGLNYRTSNIITGIVRRQLPYLEKHIRQKKAIYKRYKEDLVDLSMEMNPFDAESSASNYWLSCLTIRKEAIYPQVRGEKDSLYINEPGGSCPAEILGALAAFNTEDRPIWKPTHMQPIYRIHGFVTRFGPGRAGSSVYIEEEDVVDVGTDIFGRGLCLPSDNKMTAKEQDVVVDVIHRCSE